jgi:CHASE2 domain-containing sensor protein
MAKLVILEIGAGGFEQGFPIALQISEEGQPAMAKITGYLPKAPEMPLYYHRWQAHYNELDQLYRLSAVDNPPPANVSREQLIKKCQDLASILRSRMNAWIRTDDFSVIRENWFKRVQMDDVVRVVIDVRDRELQQLPWHLLDMMEGYTNLEIAVGGSFDKPAGRSVVHQQVNLLAILGDSRGINTKADAAILKQLPNAQVEFLVEPDRKHLTDKLWEQPWDILFFAGHSSSKQNYEAGVIYLNQTDKLTISELKYALRKAIAKGLKLAIFNSCDGLGLARELADLCIPQVIVMREPVPDRVAQEFLKYFLQAYAAGEPLYLAVRQARERLQGLEKEFPCATWLPMIFQNLAEQPPTWQALGGRTALPPTPVSNPPDPIAPVEVTASPEPPHRLSLLQVLGTSVAVTIAIAGIRHLGWLQSAELKAYDQLMQARSIVQPETWDQRILVLGIDDSTYKAEVSNKKNELKSGRSISESSLIQLLDKLEQYQPAAIGLDLQLDDKTLSPQLANRLKQGKAVFGTCFRPHPEVPGFAPPRGIDRDNRLGFSDLAIDDQQNTVRRHLLFQNPPPANSLCAPIGSLSLMLAQQYLETQHNITMKTVSDPHTAQEYMQLGPVTFRHLDGQPGGYQQTRNRDHLGGSQVLLNYRDAKIQEIPVIDVLSGQRLQERDIRNRVILVGVTRIDGQGKDMFVTPYSQGQSIRGVFIHAQMVSQVLSAVLDQRPLLQVWPGWIEVLWLGGWVTLGGVVIGQLGILRDRLIGLTVVGVILYAGCLVILIHGFWVPLIPCGLGLGLNYGGLALQQIIAARQHRKLWVN